MLAERMRARVEALDVEHRASGVASHLTVSLGVASIVPRPGVRPEDLVDRPTRPLRGEEGGRNRVTTATSCPAHRRRQGRPAVAPPQLQRKRRRRARRSPRPTRRATRVAALEARSSLPA